MVWYKNTSIWSVLMASLAIVLSQLPPIATWIPSPNIDIKHADRINVNNAMGLIGYNLNVELRNTGNTDIQLEKMSLEVITPDNKAITYPAENYTKISTGNTNPVALPITTISIPSGSEWSEGVFFTRQISTQTEEAYLAIRQNIAQSIFDKQQRDGEQYGIRASIPADDEAIETALHFFNENFDLEKGHYKVRLKVFIEGRDSPFEYNSEFTIFSHHIDMLRSQTDDYKYGAGIIMPPNPAKQVWVKFKS